MTRWRLTVSHPSLPALLTIERATLTDLMVDFGGLALEGCSLVGDPEPVVVPDYEEAAVA